MFYINRHIMVGALAVVSATVLSAGKATAKGFPRPQPGDPMILTLNAPATVKKGTAINYIATLSDMDKADIDDTTSTVPDNYLDCGGAITSVKPGYYLQSQGAAQNGVRKWDLKGTAKDMARTYTDGWSGLNPNPDQRVVDPQVYKNANIEVTE